MELQIQRAAHRRRGKWDRTEGKSILPAQRLEAPAHGLESAGAADAGEARFERVCGIWCDHRCCTLLLYPSPYRGSRFRIMSLTCGARGTRTPGPLLANRRQGIHSSMYVQVSVSGCAQRSSGILAGCCTFLLYTFSPWPARAPRRRIAGPSQYLRYRAGFLHPSAAGTGPPVPQRRSRSAVYAPWCAARIAAAVRTGLPRLSTGHGRAGATKVSRVAPPAGSASGVPVIDANLLEVAFTRDHVVGFVAGHCQDDVKTAALRTADATGSGASAGRAAGLRRTCASPAPR